MISKYRKTSKAYQLQRRSQQGEKKRYQNTSSAEAAGHKVNTREGCQSILTAEAVFNRKKDLQSISIAEEVSNQTRHTGMSKHINCRDSLTREEKFHNNIVSTVSHEGTPSKLCNNQEVNTVTAEVSSGVDINAEDTETPQTKITETSLHTKIQMQPKCMRIPIFHHTSPTKYRHHTNGEEWTASKQETLQP
jgi:hypothetical protein